MNRRELLRAALVLPAAAVLAPLASAPPYSGLEDFTELAMRTGTPGGIDVSVYDAVIREEYADWIDRDGNVLAVAADGQGYTATFRVYERFS